MAKIISYKECEARNQCEHCEWGECEASSKEGCFKCTSHCPCCIGCEEGFCDQCAEKECDNRNKPYDPNAISKEE